jgi:hypothetical protein
MINVRPNGMPGMGKNLIATRLLRPVSFVTAWRGMPLVRDAGHGVPPDGSVAIASRARDHPGIDLDVATLGAT